MLFAGIDVGTQGARCLLVDEAGEVLGEGRSPLRTPAVEGLPEGWFEQCPDDWLEAASIAVREAVEQLARSGRSATGIRGIGVTSTSGTLCAVDGRGRALGPAIMYSDSRSVEEADAVQDAGATLAASLGYRFKPSFGLPKILWLKSNRPDLFARAHLFLSPTDFLIGWLTGRWGRTDQTNALKFGYDLLGHTWPEFIEGRLGIALDKLPRVQMTGREAGRLRADLAGQLGLPAGMPVAAGLTDGCASQVSSGAVEPGDFNTTIGTTLVVKGVSQKLLLDPRGRIYCHLHPEGFWLPGGASNTGGRYLEEKFSRRERDRLSTRALEASPTALVAYPLVGRGERFPFLRPEAEGFVIGEPADRTALFTACLEGVACLERLALETLVALGAELGDRVYSAGGGAQNVAWLQIRADTLRRTVLRPEAAGAAMGAAIVAAGMVAFGKLTEAARRMVRIELEVMPRAGTAALYDEKYGLFLQECRRRGYVDE